MPNELTGRRIAFLTATVDERLECKALANPESADRLGTVDLVGAAGDQVGSLGDRHAAETLHRVAEHQRAHLPGNGGDLGDRLNNPDLIID